jgi:hypothetical protein
MKVIINFPEHDWNSGIMNFENQEALDKFLADDMPKKQWGMSGTMTITSQGEIEKDPEHIRQKDIEEANYNLSSGKAIIGLIGGLNLQKQREGTFNVSMAEYLTHFSVPFNLLSAGAIDNSLAFLHGLSSMGPYSKEEIEQIKGFHVEAINNRPKR